MGYAFPLERTTDAAVLADTPEVDSHHDDSDERKHEYMKHVPPQQGIAADFDTTKKYESDLFTKHGRKAHHVGTHGHCPQGQVDPRAAGSR